MRGVNEPLDIAFAWTQLDECHAVSEITRGMSLAVIKHKVLPL
jgi:hypothetical protein